MNCRYCGARKRHVRGCTRPQPKPRPVQLSAGEGARRCLYCRDPCKDIIGLCPRCQAELDAAKAAPEYQEV